MLLARPRSENEWFLQSGGQLRCGPVSWHDSPVGWEEQSGAFREPDRRKPSWRRSAESFATAVPRAPEAGGVLGLMTPGRGARVLGEDRRDDEEKTLVK